MSNDALNALRHDINEIDSDLLVLLAKRRRISHSVVEYKIANNKPIRDEAREQALLEKLISYGKSLGLDAYYINNVFQTILEDSVLNQQAMLQKSLNPDAMSERAISISSRILFETVEKPSTISSASLRTTKN